MYPILFELFGRPIAAYGISIIIGAFAAWFLVRLLHAKKDPDMPLVFLMCICGGLIGLFLLRPITRIPEVIINWDRIKEMPVGHFFSFMFGELVFYGGLLGGVTAMLIFCKGYKIPVLPYADLFAPGIALAHGFGRIGCFMGGCCYGCPVSASHPFAVVYPQISLAAPPGVPLMATPLIEAICLFVLAAILSVIYKKSSIRGLAVCSYGVLYSILRFVLEYYRGDLVRGVYGPFSTSQYISIGVFVLSVTLICIIVKRTRRQIHPAE